MDQQRTDSTTRTLMIIYLIGLFWLIVLKFNVALLWLGKERSLNLIPYSNMARTPGGGIDLNELVLNAVVFMPVGMYTGMLFRRWPAWKHIAFFFSFTLLCEALQYILGVGAADMTDVANNTLGGIIGLALWKLIEKLSSNRIGAQRAINTLAIIGTVLLASLLIYLRVNEIWLFRMHTIH